MSFHVRAINPQLSASVDRLINGILTEGILVPSANSAAPGASFIVREQPTPDMSVRVGSGVAGDRIVIDASSTFEVSYVGRLPDATQTVTIAVGDPSNDRIDLVVARVYDDEIDSSGRTEGVVEVVEGTPAATPSAPAVPDGAAALAEVLVTAGESTSIVTGDITDRRIKSRTRGGGLIDVVEFTADGTFDKGDYPWLRAVRAYATGSGGGGAGAQATAAGEASSGGGGSAGGTGIALVAAIDLATSETVTVAAGGAGSTGGNTGGAGATSSFGSHCSGFGGSGGTTLLAGASDNFVAGREGGNATGDVKIRGGPGGGNARLPGLNTAYGGHGGSSYHGGGAPQTAQSGDGASAGANAWGAGGAGASNRASETAGTGGNGGDGIVIVELYA